MKLKDILIKWKDYDKIAIRDVNNEITYKDLSCVVQENSKLVREYNKAKNVGIFLPNSIEYAIAYFSITFSDKVIVPIPIQAKKFEIESAIRYCELNMIITSSYYLNELKDLLVNLDCSIKIYNIEDRSITFVGIKKESCINCNSNNEEENINDESVAIMLHTSGTTSNPKRVMLTHKNLIANIRSNVKSLNLSENDKVLIALPMFFGYCNTAQFLTHLYLGASIIIMGNVFLPNNFLRIVQDEKITNFTSVPSMLLMLLSYREKFKYNISSLRYICFGGGYMPVEKLKLLVKTFPTVGFVQTYGQTEASPRVTALLPNDCLRKIGSVGKPIPDVNVRIIDEHGDDVEIGEIGEIIVKGPNVMKGYYKREEETQRIIRNGWLYTGDLAKYDEDEYIYLVGRKKNIIVSGGINIYPEEIEEILLKHEAIKEACVTAEKHDVLGEIPVARIILKEVVKNVTEGEIKNYCIDNLANYKVPRKIEFIEQLSKTYTGKTKRC